MLYRPTPFFNTLKSIKTNPNSAKGPDKGKIINKLYCILLTTLSLLDYIFVEKKQTRSIDIFFKLY
jgi:hypothetical protein